MKLEKTLQQCVSFAIVVTVIFVFASVVKTQEITPTCDRTIKADVVAFDQPFFYNRLGAVNPAGMIYALRSDVKPKSSTTGLVPGNVTLKDYKRARPIVLRLNVGDCLVIVFQNLLDPNRVDPDQPATRTAGIHAVGLNLRNTILDDGSYVGTNPPSIVSPGNSITYTWYAEKEGNHVIYSTAATTGGQRVAQGVPALAPERLAGADRPPQRAPPAGTPGPDARPP